MSAHLLHHRQNPWFSLVILVCADDKVDLLRMTIRLKFRSKAIVRVWWCLWDSRFCEKALAGHGAGVVWI
jgi:hypothetical protein